MKPTEILSREHRVIEQVLSCLEKIAQQSQSAGRLEKQSAEQAIAFFRVFADQCHHGKEEAHLFPAMEAKGFPRQGGPTGVMLQEHEQGRAHVRGMAEALDTAAAGDAAALERFVEHATGYIGLLREHIYKEETILYVMADRAFSEEDQRKLLSAFAKVEAEEVGGGRHETYLRIANDLTDRLGVPRASGEGEGAPTCGCGH
jgi:hemerythrin-like domain-containing protein